MKPFPKLNPLKIKYAINLHKGLTAIVVLSLMALYDNWTLGPWVYLALHGTYGVLWLLKDRLYPDHQWEETYPLSSLIAAFALLSLYWVAPFLLIYRGFSPPLPLVAAAIFLNILGVFLHYGSDAQKYFTLQYRRGLIEEGFFARCRNTNYLGEILIYLSFALLSLHWLPYLILAGFVGAIFVPNMLKKERSLGRYPEFAAYRRRSGLIVPQVWPALFVPEESKAIVPPEQP